MDDETRWFFPRGDLAHDDWQTVVDGELDGWQHTGLRVGELADAAELRLPPRQVERMVVPLTGDVVVEWSDARGGSGTVELAGRASVFEGPADVVYLGVGTEARLTGSGRVAVAEAPADQVLDLQVLRAADIPVEIRGAGRSTRQVHNFGTPAGLHAQKLIVCEVVTPAENWSSYPPHKHDESVPGTESRLEEIYYFESAASRGLDAPAQADPFGMFATYSSPAGQIHVDQLVRTGDVALVPYGYHGPAVAAPGYDLYYLNVMAGPDPERAWLITDDPAHGWVRTRWESQDPDPRLPYLPSAAPKGHRP
ncbi:5-deoxy-glucuronate isomerase [Frigoribacterium sp. PvP120]|jgi:5-deoxy-glucuronate isomerase|uniref:5-deoxy-glucuronate isomerase n=1 Tax=unclassified Frigoribacterium TaxID=2627005 RepID=UPI001AE1C358|nr:5-deoxy-glucuronate isomerase [Frigoribacterium sp. PvP121]MBP1239724.1 5-deoxy-glucuronate isomerase [Frigoribacterium sp. PvP121]